MDKQIILKFPKNFIWGVSTSAHQVEGGAINDWSQWERLRSKDQDGGDFICGPACDSYNRYEEDLELVKSLNCRAFRIGIEWARLEPKEGEINKNEIEHYREVLMSFRDKGIKSVVTLWHWTSPVWFKDLGGWSNPQAIKFCRRRGLKHIYLQRLPNLRLKHKFDVIICLDVLEHIADDLTALKTIHHLLKTDGRLILTVPVYPWLFSYWDKILGHYRRYTPSRLERVLKRAKLKPIKITFVYTFLLPLIVPFRLIRQIVFTRIKPQSDFINLPMWLHKLLFKLASVEHKFLRSYNLPFGLSLFCIVQKQ